MVAFWAIFLCYRNIIRMWEAVQCRNWNWLVWNRWDCNVWNISAVNKICASDSTIEQNSKARGGKCFAPWNLLVPHTRLSNVPDLERSAVLLQRHVVFAGRNDAARSCQPISCASVRGHVRARVEEPRAHVRYCAQAPVEKFALGSGDVTKRKNTAVAKSVFFLLLKKSRSLRVWHFTCKAD